MTRTLNEIEMVRLAIEHPRKFVGLLPMTRIDRIVDRLTGYRSASVVHFDAASSKLAAELSLDWFDVLVRLLPLVRLPTERCVIVLDNTAVMEATSRFADKLFADRPPVKYDNNQRVYLCERVGLTSLRLWDTFFINDPNKYPFRQELVFFPPWDWHFEADVEYDALPPYLAEFARLFRRVIDDHPVMINADGVRLEGPGRGDAGARSMLAAIALGSLAVKWFVPDVGDTTYGRLEIGDDDPDRIRFLSRVGIRPLVRVPCYDIEDVTMVHSTLTESAGAIRTALAALALLSLKVEQPVQLDRTTRPAGRIYHAGRYAPYFGASTVRLVLPEPKVKKLLHDAARALPGESGIHHRRHGVRGHWCQRGGARGCVHSLEDVSPNRKVCRTCEALVYWRKEHERGDASLGWVQRTEFYVETRK